MNDLNISFDNQQYPVVRQKPTHQKTKATVPSNSHFIMQKIYTFGQNEN